MKLSVDLSELKKAVKKMNAKEIDFNINLEHSDVEKIDIQLNKGLEITLNDISRNSKGLINYEDRHVLLYIKDNTYKTMESIKADPNNGSRFHIADCTKLKEMRSNRRGYRYIVTNQLNGYFEIISRDGNNNPITDVVKLYVCKYCLSYLNYKNYNNTRDDSIQKQFSIYEFFETYSSCFHYKPLSSMDISETLYAKDWKSISKKYRQKQGYICESCGVDLSNIPYLLHVHHRDGNKGNNVESNLIALCADCHRKYPLHDHMFLSDIDMYKISTARIEQNIIKNNHWDDVYKFSDKALYGLIGLLKEKNSNLIPVLFHKLQLKNDQNLYLELAWPKYKVGITLIDKNLERFNSIGWRVYSVKEILDKHDKTGSIDILEPVKKSL